MTQAASPAASTDQQVCLCLCGLTPQSQEAAAIIYAKITRQASLIAFNQAFDMLGWVLLALLPILLVIRRPAQTVQSVAGH